MMASLVDMSLEDIIQKKRQKQRNNRNIKGKINTVKPKQSNKVSGLNQKLPAIDARNKIILKKRTQITDAREKLAQLAKQKDARLKLEQLRQKKMAFTKGMHKKNSALQGRSDNQMWLKTIHNREPVFSDPSRQIRLQQHSGKMRSNQSMRQRDNVKRFMESRSIEARHIDRGMPRVKPIFRTVANDIIVMDDDEDDPMCGDMPLGRQQTNLNLKIVAHNNGSRSTGDIRSAPSYKERSPQRPLPSILKKRPLAAMRSDRKPETKTEPPQLECRVIVSNLRNTVTDDDIKELFGEVGGMLESRLIRSGIAEVIYKTQENAQKAVDIYHNRQLDGQPMNCLLVAPRAPAAKGSSSKPQLPASSSSNVEPDISTFHKVLFSHF